MSPRRSAPSTKSPLKKKSALWNAAPIFAALGDETRLRLIAVLLHVLGDAGMVRDVKVGRERLWEFEPTQVEEARRSLEVIGQQWDNALNKLKMTVKVDETGIFEA